MGVIEGSGARIHTRNLGSPAAASTGVVLAATEDTGEEQEITEGITDPDVPRNLTATAGGTAGDIKAISVTVHGTNAEGQPISEVLPAFTADSAGTVVGSKAFATVVRAEIPAHDGTGATTAIGVGDKLGIGVRLERDTVVNAYLDGVREGTRPTVVVEPDDLESNTVDLSSALNGDEVLVDLYPTG